MLYEVITNIRRFSRKKLTFEDLIDRGAGDASILGDQQLDPNVRNNFV